MRTLTTMTGVLGALALAAQAGAATIASTSFENEAPGSFPQITATNAIANPMPIGTVVDIVNYDNTANVPFDIATVDSTTSSANAGDLGFNSAWVNTANLNGLSDGDAIGVVTSNLNGAWSDGSQGYRFEDPAGRLTVTFDAVDLTNYKNVVASIDTMFSPTGWTPGTHIFKATVFTDVGDYVLLSTDSGGTDPDSGLETVWTTHQAQISDSATTAYLQVYFQIDATDSARRITLDDVSFTGDLVPEPASLGLLGLAGLTLCRRRR